MISEIHNQSFAKYKELFDDGFFEPIDAHFADFVLKKEKSADAMLYLISLLISRNTRAGSVCLNLNTLMEDFSEISPLKEDIKRICASQGFLKSLKTVSFSPDAPMVLDNDKLYLQRYFLYERNISEKIRSLMVKKPEINEDVLNESAMVLLNETMSSNQKMAVLNSVRNYFSVITGGPGTGKTATVVAVIALVIEQHLQKKEICRIALAAPTGKAASHMNNSVRNNMQRLLSTVPADKRLYYDMILSRLPLEGQTMHRLIGLTGKDVIPEYNEKRKLPYELIVIDETSMVDVPLMSKFLDSVSFSTRLVLLGDKNQLSSVQPGSVFGDICEENLPRLEQGHIVELKKSFRFSENSGIKKMGSAIKAMNGKKAFELLVSRKYPELEFIEISPVSKKTSKILKSVLKNHVVRKYEENRLFDSVTFRDPGISFSALAKFQVLCALRKGLYGIESVNGLIENILFETKIIPSYKRFYEGMPVMVVENDYVMGLYNGDIGICVKDQDVMKVCFKSNEENGAVKYRNVLPTQIKDWEKVYSMTVHKSQGSEFDEVLLILPEEFSPVLTMELVYTAVTRARKKITIMGTQDVFVKTCSKSMERSSGLKERLWNLTS